MMDKRVWTLPVAVVEQFEASEYIAACGAMGISYYFNCDAEPGSIYVYDNTVIPYDKDLDVNSVDWNSLHAYEQGTFTPCGANHGDNELSSNVIIENPVAELYWGVIDRNGNKIHDPSETLVVYFDPTGNGHASKSLNVDNWVTAKS